MQPALPDNWTHAHAIAYLVLAVSALDSQISKTEISACVRSLDAYPDIDPEEAGTIVKEAFAHLDTVTDSKDGKVLLESIALQTTLLKSRSDEVRRVILTQLAEVAAADGSIAATENAVVTAVQKVWGL